MRHREQQRTFMPPVLLTSRPAPEGDAWALEFKWNGRRAQLRYDGRSGHAPHPRRPLLLNRASNERKIH